MERDRHQNMGEELLDKALKKYNTSIKAIAASAKEFKKAFDELHAKDIDELFIHISSGRCTVKDVLKLIPSIDYKEDRKKKRDKKLFQ